MPAARLPLVGNRQCDELYLIRIILPQPCTVSLHFWSLLKSFRDFKATTAVEWKS